MVITRILIKLWQLLCESKINIFTNTSYIAPPELPTQSIVTPASGVSVLPP